MKDFLSDARSAPLVWFKNENVILETPMTRHNTPAKTIPFAKNNFFLCVEVHSRWLFRRVPWKFKISFFATISYLSLRVKPSMAQFNTAKKNNNNRNKSFYRLLQRIVKGINEALRTESVPLFVDSGWVLAVTGKKGHETENSLYFFFYTLLNHKKRKTLPAAAAEAIKCSTTDWCLCCKRTAGFPQNVARKYPEFRITIFPLQRNHKQHSIWSLMHYRAQALISTVHNVDTLIA